MLESMPADEIKDYLIYLLQHENAIPPGDGKKKSPVKPIKRKGPVELAKEKREKTGSKYDLEYQRALEESKRMESAHGDDRDVKHKPAAYLSSSEDDQGMKDFDEMSAYERSVY